MPRTYVFILAFLLISSFSRIAPAKEWRGIVPLHSTREDVEKLLGPSPFGGGWAYEFAKERVFFQYQYAKDRCGQEFGTWDVTVDTVLGVSVYPKTTLLLSDQNLDMTKFVRLNSCSPGGYTYYERIDGLSYSTQDGAIGIIGYGPALKDQARRCPMRK